MNWHYIDSGENTGKFNMDFDIQLADMVDKNNSFFRLYQWKPYCISLGANQSFDDINVDLIRQNGIDVVKRPTGGRAILHAEELTYSVCISTFSGLSSHEIYRKISLALVAGLRNYDGRLQNIELETLQPDFAKLLKLPQGKICFSSTAKSEVKFAGKKIIGSAQRKMKNSILQHGSILIGKYHRNLSKYIISSSFEENDFDDKTIELETILNQPIDLTKLKEDLASGFRQEWNIDSFVAELSEKEII